MIEELEELFKDYYIVKAHYNSRFYDIDWFDVELSTLKEDVIGFVHKLEDLGIALKSSSHIEHTFITEYDRNYYVINVNLRIKYDKQLWRSAIVMNKFNL